MLNVGIVGAGIGGLTAGIMLRSLGHKVTIFEKQSEFFSAGVGIQLSANAIRILRKFGLEDKIVEIGNYPLSIECIKGNTGKKIVSIPLGKIAEKKFHAGFYQLHRSDLISILQKKNKEIGAIISYDSPIKNVKQGNSEVILEFNNGDFVCDLLVGADGINSLVRKKIFSSDPPKYLNQVAYRTIIPANLISDMFSQDKTLLFLGSGKHIVSYPIKGGEFINFVFCTKHKNYSKENWNIDVKPSELIEHFDDFRSFDNVFKRIENLKKWGLFEHTILKNWNKNSIVLLGDACHPMLPYLAQGACQAIEDSYELCQNIGKNTKKQNLSSLLKKYSMNRYSRVEKIRVASKRNAILFHLKNPVFTFCFHAILKLSGYFPKFILKRFAWIFSGGPV